jgi:hypothetical protein
MGERQGRGRPTLRQAETGSSPSLIAYRAVQQHVERDADHEAEVDMHLTSILDGVYDAQAHHARPSRRSSAARSTAVRTTRPSPSCSGGTRRSGSCRRSHNSEWDGALKRFTTTVGDLPARDLTPAHVRNFKTALLNAKGREDRPLASATVQKRLNALKAVLSWAKREGYIPILGGYGGRARRKRGTRGLARDAGDSRATGLSASCANRPCSWDSVRLA